MKTPLAPDDLQVGQFVTMFKGRTHCESTIENPLTGQILTRTAFEDNFFKGDVLQITAVDLPFVVIRCCQGTLSGCDIHFDTRQGWIFKALSEEYVNALIPNRDLI